MQFFPGRGDLRNGWGEKEMSMMEAGTSIDLMDLSTRVISPREM